MEWKQKMKNVELKKIRKDYYFEGKSIVEIASENQMTQKDVRETLGLSNDKEKKIERDAPKPYLEKEFITGVLAQFKPEDQKILTLLSEGKSKDEIVEALNLDKGIGPLVVRQVMIKLEKLYTKV